MLTNQPTQPARLNLLARLAAAQAANRRLRRNHVTAEQRHIHAAHLVATIILDRHYAGLNTSRRATRAQIGISERQWDKGKALLRAASLMDAIGRLPDLPAPRAHSILRNYTDHLLAANNNHGNATPIRQHQAYT